ncbi:hypothetical protein WCD74_12330 [Actinomycetospora sp. OC33-EN08]|uniref:DUF4399 domain-containing protein n=1 Tax=Actinomycetospora aurantiaca TaxID=3129233 RepID=A0ABU8MPP0_9PSEU
MTVLQPGRYVHLQRAAPSRGPRRPSSSPVPVVGHLALDTSHSALAPHLATCSVQVLVDDLPLTVRWGRTDIALPPGRHRVEIAVDRGAGWGRVVEAVPVAAGHTVDVFYRAPVLPGAGTLGPVPQPTRGVVALLAGLLLLLAVVGVGVTALLALLF